MHNNGYIVYKYNKNRMIIIQLLGEATNLQTDSNKHNLLKNM